VKEAVRLRLGGVWRIHGQTPGLRIIPLDWGVEHALGRSVSGANGQVKVGGAALLKGSGVRIKRARAGGRNHSLIDLASQHPFVNRI